MTASTIWHTYVTEESLANIRENKQHNKRDLSVSEFLRKTPPPPPRVGYDKLVLSPRPWPQQPAAVWVYSRMKRYCYIQMHLVKYKDDWCRYRNYKTLTWCYVLWLTDGQPDPSIPPPLTTRCRGMTKLETLPISTRMPPLAAKECEGSFDIGEWVL